MKTNQIAIALLASTALMFSACMREENFENGDISFEKDEVMFRIGEVKTRSEAESKSVVNQIGSFTTESGETFVLEETVTSLDDASNAPETRGTPAFTENIKALYPSLYTVALKMNGDKAFENSNVKEGVKYTNEKDNIWHHRYGEDIWKEKLPTYFFIRMPGEDDNVTLGDNPYNVTDGSITFSYTSPETASKQKDILFTSYKRTKETNAEEVILYHALTGVKFANYYDNQKKEGANAKVETIIKSVTISGLRNSGICTVTPPSNTDGETGAVTFGDDKSATVSVWDNLSGNGTFSQTFDQSFAKYGSTYKLDEKLNDDAAKQNLNDENGTKTFWVIPQNLADAQDSVTLTVVFDVVLDDGTTRTTTFSNKELTVNLSGSKDAANDKLRHLIWTAGQLHTFTLKPTAVGVDIDDDLTEYEKSDVVVENTGNVWQYVRVNMVGNWWGNLWEKDVDGEPQYYKDSTILAGYATSNDDDMTETEGWNDKDNDVLGYYKDSEGNKISPLYTVNGVDYDMYGKFVNLVAKSTTSNPQVNSHHWVRFDKYYYYTLPIGPGSSVTDTFFDSYTVNPSPEFWIPDVFGVRHAAGNVHLIIDLMVQAIEAPMNEAGEETSDYMHAWAAALGYGTNVAALDNL